MSEPTTTASFITAPFKTAIQAGVVVSDLDQSMKALTEIFIIEILQPAPGSDGLTPGVVRHSAE